MRNFTDPFKRNFRQLLTCIFFLIPVAALAVDEPQQTDLRGTAVVANATLTAADPVLGTPAWSNQQAFGVQNIVQFEIDFNNTANIYFHNLNFTASCKVDINCYGNPSNPGTITQTYSNISLDINYNSATGAIYKGIANYKFNGAYKVVVKINSITATGLNLPDYPIFKLTNKLIVSRQYNFSNSTTDVVKYKTDGSKLDVQWVPTNYPGAESFDLEWTYIDGMSAEGNAIAAAPSSGIPIATLNSWFRNNSSRVNLSGSQYQFNLNYNQGYLLFRIRGVQYRNSDGLRLEADWNYNAAALAGSIYNFYNQGIVQVDWHEDKLNWQYNASYAEDGKKKEVISYFDGSMRNRQTVTLNNEDDKAIVAEPVYDAMGRSAMSIIPAPVNDNKLHYYASFNLSSRAGTPPVSYKDIPVASCGIIASALSPTSGVEQYYSANNPFLTDPTKPWNKAIPQSEGFPFAVTLYTPDNTGHVRAQGGVGQNFQLGTDHETKYFYGKPSQYELDRLFGAEAGDHTHYLKNMVQDANGQVSVSYQNSEGKTVATALAGNPPSATEPLSSSAPPLTTVHDVIITPSSFEINSAQSSLEATSTFLVSSTGDYKFTYRFTPEQYREDFSGGTLCYTCSYDLLVSIKDECGNELKKVDIKKISPFNTDCITPAEIHDLMDVDISKIGEYTAYFELKVNKETLDGYTDDYLVRNTDIKKLNYFLLQQLKDENLAECYDDCDACKTLPPTAAEFVDQIQAYYTHENLSFGPEETAYANELYETISHNCKAISKQCTVSPCADVLEILKADVTPGGQYAEFDNNYQLIDPEINVLTHYTQVSYTDENGDPVIVENSDGVSVSPAELSLKEFIEKFDESWANALVKFHPEYCYYVWCTMNEGSQLYNQKLEDLDDAIEAQNVGLFNRNDVLALLNNDPFFSPGGYGFGYHSNMQHDLEEYSSLVLNPGAAPTKNILQTIDYLLYCGNQTPAVSWGDCDKSPDDPCRSAYKEWLLYKQWYLDRKLKYYSLAMKANLKECTNCYIPSSGNADPGAWTGCIAPSAGNFTVEDVPNSSADGLKRIIIKYRDGNETTQWPLNIELLMTGPGVPPLTQTIVFAPGFGTQEVTVQDDFNSFSISGVSCAQVLDGRAASRNKLIRTGSRANQKIVQVAVPYKGGSNNPSIVNAGTTVKSQDNTKRTGATKATGTSRVSDNWDCPGTDQFTVNISNTATSSSATVCYIGPAIPAGMHITATVQYTLGAGHCQSGTHTFEACFSSGSPCFTYTLSQTDCFIQEAAVISDVCGEGLCESTPWECPTDASAFTITYQAQPGTGFTNVTVCYTGPAIPAGVSVIIPWSLITDCGEFDENFSFCNNSGACQSLLVPTRDCQVQTVSLGDPECTNEDCNWKCPEASDFVSQVTQPASGGWDIDICYTGMPIPQGKRITVPITVFTGCGPVTYNVLFCAGTALCNVHHLSDEQACGSVKDVKIGKIDCADGSCNTWECPVAASNYSTSYIYNDSDNNWTVRVCYTGAPIPVGTTVHVTVTVHSGCGDITYPLIFCAYHALCNTNILDNERVCGKILGVDISDVECVNEDCKWECPTDPSNYHITVTPLANSSYTKITVCYTGPTIPPNKSVHVFVSINSECSQATQEFIFCSGTALCLDKLVDNRECTVTSASVKYVKCGDGDCEWECPEDPSNYTLTPTLGANGEYTILTCYTGPPDACREKNKRNCSFQYFLWRKNIYGILLRRIIPLQFHAFQ